MVSSSNADMNPNELVSLVGLESAAYLEGGTTDNTPGVLKETSDTFYNIMERCKVSVNQHVKELVRINGVERHPIVFGDPFHW